MQRGHYRAVEASNVSIGERVRLVKFDPETDEVIYLRGDCTFSTSQHEFRRHFTYLPEGEAAYAAELDEAAQGFQEVTAEAERLGRESQALTLALSGTGEIEGLRALQSVAGETPQASGTELTKAQSGVQQARRAALTLGLRVNNLTALARERHQRLKALSDEAMNAALTALRPLTELVGKLKETVWTLELYAGSSEELVQILCGQPAPEATPLSIRQTTLSMAEESAMMVDDGGMDAKDVEKFDAWLREKPERINYFLPEEKGIVAFAASFGGKDYGDPLVTARWREENQYLHFLIRNGENVYRVRADMKVGSTIIPTHAEFMEMFTERRYDFDTGGYVYLPIEPGSHAYLEAEKRADEQRRYYYRVALILQGLIDRTAVFQPLPRNKEGERHIRLANKEDYASGKVRVIEDSSMAIADPREGFKAWLKRVNGEMDIGRRVIGNFSIHSHGPFGNDGRDYRSGRFFPSRVSRPPVGQPLTLEARRDGYFVALYERIDTVYRPDYAAGPAERRASVKILPTDVDVLLIDHPDVTPEIMRDFLSRRQERKHFLNMVPLLKQAIRTLEREREQEAPFLKLLSELGESLYGYSPEVAQEEAKAAIQTYKFGQRQHRTLSLEDEAFSLCAEVMKAQNAERQNRQKRKESGEFEKVTRFVLERSPEALLILHRKEGEYLTAVPERESENIYARILTLKVGRAGVRVTAEREWRTLGYEWQIGHRIYEAQRAAQWHFNPSREALTGPEVDWLKQNLASFVKAHQDEKLVAVSFDPVTYEVVEFTLPRGSQSSSQRLNAKLIMVLREGGGLKLNYGREYRVSYDHQGKRPWQQGGHAPHRVLPNGVELLMEDRELIGCLDESVKQADEQARARQALFEAVSRAKRPLVAQYRELQWEEKYQHFLDTYGHDSAHLWEGHKKTIKEADFPSHDQLFYHSGAVWDILSALIRGGIPLAGLTLAEAKHRAEALTGQSYAADPKLLGLTLTE